MSVEAMKQALEALEHGLDYAKSEQFENAQRYKGYEHLAPNDADSVQLIETAITSLRQAIAEAEKQEPVAKVDASGWFDWLIDYDLKDCFLYTHPPQRSEDAKQPKVEQEPVAWMRQDGQRVTTAGDRQNYPDYETRYSIPLYTHPQPEREWADLTEDEVTEIIEKFYPRSYGMDAVVIAAQTKLRNKNT